MRPTPAPRRTLLIGLVLAAAGTGLAGCTSAPSQPEVAQAGYQAGDGTLTLWAPDERPAPVDIAGTTFQGEEVDLADWRGRIVLLNFWYAACPPCRAEAPDLAAIDADYPDETVTLLGINNVDDTPTVEAFNNTFGITYPSLDDRDAKAVASLEGLVPLRAMPTTVLLDHRGRPAARIVGLADGNTLRSLIDELEAEYTADS